MKIIIKFVYAFIFVIFYSFIFNSCASTNKTVISPENPVNNNFPKTKYNKKLLYFEDFDTTVETAELFFWKAVMLYRKNQLKKSEKIMEKAKLLAFLYDTSWKDVIDTNLRYIYYDIKDYKKLYYLEKERNNLSPFVNFLRNIADEELYKVKGLTNSGIVKLKEYNGDFQIPVTINGKSDEYFLIDTASNLTIISTEIAKKYSIKYMQEGIAGYDNRYLSLINVKYAVIESLQIGDITIYNVPVGIVDTKSLTWKRMGMFTYFKVDGILGIPVLREFITTLDYPNKTLILDKENSPSSNDCYDMYFINSFIQIPLEINGVNNFNFCIDSASEMTEFYKNGIDRLKQFYSNDVFIEKTGKGIETIYGKKDIYGIYYPKYFIINNYTLQNVPLLVSSHNTPQFVYEEHGNLGLDILRQFKVIFDFKNMKMYLSLPEKKD